MHYLHTTNNLPLAVFAIFAPFVLLQLLVKVFVLLQLLVKVFMLLQPFVKVFVLFATICQGFVLFATIGQGCCKSAQFSDFVGTEKIVRLPNAVIP